MLIPHKGKYRIADLVFDLENGESVVCEIQLSKISMEDLEERTDDYHSIGHSVIWWFGKNAKRPENVDWHREYLGFNPCLLDFEYEEEVSVASKSLIDT